MRQVIVIATMLLLANVTHAATINIIGTYASWPTDVQWISIPSLNDPDDALPDDWLDFVGDASNPGAYWQYNTDYFFFRVRVDAGTVNVGTFSDSLFVLIDKVGYGVESGPDFAFAWDSKSRDSSQHGLEMMVNDINGVVWSGTRMGDLDGNNAQKLPNDINGGGRTTDGYLRTIDGISTVNFGTTSFVDFAIQWNYLQTYTPLGSNQFWRFQLATIAGASDHNFLNYDIAGGASPSSSPSSGWSPPIWVPEPSATTLLAFGTISLLFRRKLARQG